MARKKSKYECDECKNYNGRFTGACRAFKKGIPFPIASGEISHREPYEGDGGIVFEKIK